MADQTHPTETLAETTTGPGMTEPKSSRPSRHVDFGYEPSRKQDLDGLVQSQTLRSIPHDQVEEGIRMFGSRPIDALKQVREEKRRKSR